MKDLIKECEKLDYKLINNDIKQFLLCEQIKEIRNNPINYKSMYTLYEIISHTTLDENISVSYIFNSIYEIYKMDLVKSINFGKYKNYTFYQLLKEDKLYFKWLTLDCACKIPISMCYISLIMQELICGLRFSKKELISMHINLNMPIQSFDEYKNNSRNFIKYLRKQIDLKLTSDMHIDHITSIKYCYENNIPIDICNSLKNLSLTLSCFNLSKNSKCMPEIIDIKTVSPDFLFSEWIKCSKRNIDKNENKILITEHFKPDYDIIVPIINEHNKKISDMEKEFNKKISNMEKKFKKDNSFK